MTPIDLGLENFRESYPDYGPNELIMENHKFRSDYFFYLPTGKVQINSEPFPSTLLTETLPP
jgi:hypothetical protein